MSCLTLAPKFCFPFVFFPKMELTVQQNHFKIELKRLEDDLLNRLSAAHGNFLGDISLVEQLENTKNTATHIQCKVGLRVRVRFKKKHFFLTFFTPSFKCFMTVTEGHPHPSTYYISHK